MKSYEINGKRYMADSDGEGGWNIHLQDGGTIKLIETEFEGECVFAFDPELADQLGKAIKDAQKNG